MLEITRKIWLLCFLGLLVLGGAQAAHAATVDRLMDVSGMRHALAQLPGVVGASFDSPQAADMPPALRSAMRDAAGQAFRAQDLAAVVRDRLARDLSERQVADAVAFYETLLGRRIIEMEMKASEPAALPQFEAYARELQQRPAPEARRRLIEAYDAATGSTDAAVAIMESTALAVALAFNAVQPRQAQVSAQDLQRKLKEAGPQLQSQARAYVAASLLYTYRALGDRELGDYVRFLQTPSGAAHARASAQAFRHVITEAMARFAQSLPKAVERSRGAART